jgi:hypothetical protein
MSPYREEGEKKARIAFVLQYIYLNMALYIKRV